MNTNNKFSWLLSPWAILSGIACGLVLGLFFKNGLIYYSFVSKMFLDLLAMCVVPLLISAVSTSIARFIRQHNAATTLLVMMSAIIILLFICAAFGLILGIISNNAHHIHEARSTIGKLILNAGAHSSYATTETTGQGLLKLMSGIIPNNIIYAMANNKILSLLTFSILFGFLLGHSRSTSANKVYELLEGIFELFLKLISRIIYLLPFGLTALIAQQIATTGLNLLQSLGSLMLYMYIGCTVLCLIFIISIAVLAKRSLKYTFMNLRNVMLMAFVSSSSFTTLPFALASLEERFSSNRDSIGLFLPFNICLNPCGSVLITSIFVIYLANLYGIHLSMLNYMVILLGSVFTGIAGSSLPAIASVSMLTIVLTPLGISSKTAIILMISIANFVDPILTLANVLGNCMLSLVFEFFLNKKDVMTEINQPIQYNNEVANTLEPL